MGTAVRTSAGLIVVLLLSLVFPVVAAASMLDRFRGLRDAGWTGQVAIKLRRDADFVVEAQRIRGLRGQSVLDVVDLRASGALTASSSARLTPLFARHAQALREERRQLEAQCFCELPDLASFVTLRLTGPLEQHWPLLERLNRMPDIEYAYPVPMPVPAAADLAPLTPSFASQQGYLEAAPIGIDVPFVRALAGGRGEGVKVGDVEESWTVDHEDLPTCTNANGYSTDPRDIAKNGHGDAVLGQLFAADNAYGVTGIVPAAQCQTSSHILPDKTWSVAAAVERHTATMGPGDVILVELQLQGPHTPADDPQTQVGYVPAEYDPATFAAVQVAVQKGIVVVAAAGNGGEDLDHPDYAGFFDRTRRFSGALLVGAGAAHPFCMWGTEVVAARARLPFSNYGSRVDVQGWGCNVVTTGYGGLFDGNGLPGGAGDVRQTYTAFFSGTSSASPIVAGAVALLQSVRKASGEPPFSPAEVLEILRRTGTPQTGSDGEHIGPLPNLRAALTELARCGDGRRDSNEVCDDGNRRDGDGCSASCMSNESCGNQVVDRVSGEVCDDGNTADGDGCAADCGSTEWCGNGVVDAAIGEICDDGNHAQGDGCAADCRSLERCGDGVIDRHLGERCDDGNTRSGDGCAADCTSDESRGNGIIDSQVGERCDDGNAYAGDGCDPDCLGQCGYGVVQSPEQCDDGGVKDGDGCNRVCQSETLRSMQPLAAVDATSSAGSKAGCSAAPNSAASNGTASNSAASSAPATALIASFLLVRLIRR